jgi:hypothetical protein
MTPEHLRISPMNKFLSLLIAAAFAFGVVGAQAATNAAAPGKAASAAKDSKKKAKKPAVKKAAKKERQ